MIEEEEEEEGEEGEEQRMRKRRGGEEGRRQSKVVSTLGQSLSSNVNKIETDPKSERESLGCLSFRGESHTRSHCDTQRLLLPPTSILSICAPRWMLPLRNARLPSAQDLPQAPCRPMALGRLPEAALPGPQLEPRSTYQPSFPGPELPPTAGCHGFAMPTKWRC